MLIGSDGKTRVATAFSEHNYHAYLIETIKSLKMQTNSSLIHQNKNCNELTFSRPNLIRNFQT